MHPVPGLRLDVRPGFYRFESDDHVRSRFQPQRKLKFRGSTQKPPREAVPLDWVVHKHPTLTKILPVLGLHGRSDRAVIKKVSVNWLCDPAKNPSRKREHCDGCVCCDLIGLSVPIAEFGPDGIRNQHLAQGRTLLADLSELIDHTESVVVDE